MRGLKGSKGSLMAFSRSRVEVNDGKSDWTKWADRFVVIVSSLVHIPMCLLIALGGFADGVVPLAILGIVATAYYVYLLCEQISSSVSLTEDGIKLRSRSREEFIAFCEIELPAIEEWNGGAYMISTWPIRTKLPVIYTKSGTRIALDRAYGPKKQVVALLDLIAAGKNLKDS